MPRITPVNPDQATGQSKELLEIVKGKLGGTPNLLTTMAHSPAVLKSYLEFSGALGGASLSAASPASRRSRPSGARPATPRRRRSSIWPWRSTRSGAGSATTTSRPRPTRA